ncbi:GCN5-related N-acetyltransferase [Kribbella flavida DSM 17836]|uniref:GCN5-related N-acetyltransferase n=1 Tax=Kribbella flavida (strain DSM 17836 / JCM 10339 / NBRC 14399) TaxID=479435 RepID=D2PLV6_KRIFD|nr:GNAT family N-acetyltransferase [Kribbella flavida]ADB32536.1 GCN5-related N-acetyltransferase [Kribbella flavida DSM 17836]
MLLRPAAADDRDFLAEMLLAAYNWDGRPRFTAAQLRAEDHAWRYVDEWPRAGDFGVVAENAGRPVGAAWARLLPGARPGYGYVADDVPELSIGVTPEARGRGVGRALLTELIAAARRAQYGRLSLSVEPANRAADLYRSLGFAEVGRTGGSDTMVLEL